MKSNDTVFAWMVEWLAGLITRHVKGRVGRTAYREARGHGAQALVAEFEEIVMYNYVRENRQEQSTNGREGSRNESIFGTPHGVIKAKTVRRLPEDAEVLNTHGVPSKTNSRCVKGHVPIEANEARRAEPGEDEPVLAQLREECDARTTVAALHLTVGTMYVTRAQLEHQCQRGVLRMQEL